MGNSHRTEHKARIYAELFRTLATTISDLGIPREPSYWTLETQLAKVADNLTVQEMEDMGQFLRRLVWEADMAGLVTRSSITREETGDNVKVETGIAILAFENLCKRERATRKAAETLTQRVKQVPDEDMAEYVRRTEAIQAQYGS